MTRYSNHEDKVSNHEGDIMRTKIERLIRSRMTKIALATCALLGFAMPVQAHELGVSIHVLAHEALHALPILGMVAIISLVVHFLRQSNTGQSSKARKR